MTNAPDTEKLRSSRPWRRLRGGNGNLRDRLKLPDDIRLGDVRTPEVKLPDMRIPDVKLPEVRLPDIRLQDIKLPDVKLPDVKLPDVKLPDRMDIPGGFELRRRSATRIPVVVIVGVAGVIGALATFLLDPRVGASRRAYARDRLAAIGRRLSHRAAHTGRWLASDTMGLVERLRGAVEPEPQLDEVELAHKVETELFRDQSIDKGHLSINAERDVVFLRGVAPTPEAVADIEGRVRRIEGVRHVVNLLHLPGTRAPNEPFGEPAPAPHA